MALTDWLRRSGVNEVGTDEVAPMVWLRQKSFGWVFPARWLLQCGFYKVAPVGWLGWGSFDEVTLTGWLRWSGSCEEGFDGMAFAL